MSQRVLNVTAYTTFDYLQGSSAGIDWEDDGIMVLNVDSDDETGVVRLSVELDPMDQQRTEQHADHVELLPEQARTLASKLKEQAAQVDAEGADD